MTDSNAFISAEQQPHLRLSTVVLDAADANELAAFYRRLLGWATERQEDDWVLLRAPEGAALSFQTEEGYVPPTWPSRERPMMMHLDIEVDDLEAAGAHAIECGAVLADYQPQERVRVYFDPAGHPFCLWVAT